MLNLDETEVSKLGDLNAEVPVNRTQRLTKYTEQVLGEPLKHKSSKLTVTENLLYLDIILHHLK